jgi:hypothetical protein
MASDAIRTRWTEELKKRLLTVLLSFNLVVSVLSLGCAHLTWLAAMEAVDQVEREKAFRDRQDANIWKAIAAHRAELDRLNRRWSD